MRTFHDSEHGESPWKTDVKIQADMQVDLKPKPVSFSCPTSSNNRCITRGLTNVCESYFSLWLANVTTCLNAITHFQNIGIKCIFSNVWWCDSCKYLWAYKAQLSTHLVCLCCCWTAARSSSQAGAADCPLRLHSARHRRWRMPATGCRGMNVCCLLTFCWTQTWGNSQHLRLRVMNSPAGMISYFFFPKPQ